jgi:excisionase family DNA binding protein
MSDRIAYTRAEAAAAIGMGLTTFETRVQPELRVIRVGRKVLIPAGELERWVAEHAEPSPTRRKIES